MSTSLSRVFALLIAVPGLFLAATATPLAGTPQGAAAGPPQNAYTLSIARNGLITEVSLNSEGAPLSRIAADVAEP